MDIKIPENGIMEGMPFVDMARAQTMHRDFDRLRKAIASWDPEATEKAWEKCERWVSCLNPHP